LDKGGLFVRFLFPTRLGRFDYALRSIFVTLGVILALHGTVTRFIDSPVLIPLLCVMSILFPLYLLAWVHLPRIRDMGWHPIALVAVVVPWVNLLLWALLLGTRAEQKSGAIDQ